MDFHGVSCVWRMATGHQFVCSARTTIRMVSRPTSTIISTRFGRASRPTASNSTRETVIPAVQDVEIIVATIEGRNLVKNGQAPEMCLWCRRFSQRQNSSSRPQRLELRQYSPCCVPQIDQFTSRESSVVGLHHPRGLLREGPMSRARHRGRREQA